MIADFFAFLFSFFLLMPLEAGIRDRLEESGASVAVMEQARDCVSAVGPGLVTRAGDDPWWATTTAIGLATGYTTPESVIDTKHPACAALLGAPGTAEPQATAPDGDEIDV